MNFKSNLVAHEVRDRRTAYTKIRHDSHSPPQYAFFPVTSETGVISKIFKSSQADQFSM